MKKVVLIVLVLLFCVTIAGAYSFQFIGPPRTSGSLTGYVGEPIIIEAESRNLPPGVTMTLQVQGPLGYYRTFPMVVQHGGYFSTTFNTKGLREGVYRFEIQSPPSYPLGSARNWFMVNLIDRSDTLRITSPIRQELTGWLSIDGEVADHGAAGVELTVYDQGDRIIFGPEWISTSQRGWFSTMVPAHDPGFYSVHVADRRGLIGIVDFEIYRKIIPTPTPPVSTPVPPQIVSASATASRESPAHFVMRTERGPVTLSTLLGADWVIEYIDESGTLHIADIGGTHTPETVTFEGHGGTVYIRAYPDTDKTDTFYLYGQNVASITRSSTPEGMFGEIKPTSKPPAEESPVCVLLPLIAVGALIVIYARRP